MVKLQYVGIEGMFYCCASLICFVISFVLLPYLSFLTLIIITPIIITEIEHTNISICVNHNLLLMDFPTMPLRQPFHGRLVFSSGHSPIGILYLDNR